VLQYLKSQRVNDSTNSGMNSTHHNFKHKQIINYTDKRKVAGCSD